MVHPDRNIHDSPDRRQRCLHRKLCDCRLSRQRLPTMTTSVGRAHFRSVATSTVRPFRSRLTATPSPSQTRRSSSTLSNASNGVEISDSRVIWDHCQHMTASGGAYDIQVSYVGDARFAATFDAAAARWEKVIVGDVPDISVANLGLIDDLRIDATVVSIDGVGGILGQAGPDGLRPTHAASLPWNHAVRCR